MSQRGVLLSEERGHGASESNSTPDTNKELPGGGARETAESGVSDEPGGLGQDRGLRSVMSEKQPAQQHQQVRQQQRKHHDRASSRKADSDLPPVKESTAAQSVAAKTLMGKNAAASPPPPAPESLS